MGRDKACLRLGETTFMRRAATALQTVTIKPIVVVGGSSAEESTNEFHFLPDDFKSDNEKNRRAAIIGLRTVFRHSKTAWAAVVACDLPFAGAELFERLAALRTTESEAIVPVQPDGRWQPLCALYLSETCLPQVEEMLEKSIWSVKELLGRVRTRLVEFAEFADLPNSERFFLNVNTPADYKLALHLETLNQR